MERPIPPLRTSTKKVSPGPTIINTSRQRETALPEKSANEMIATIVVARAIPTAIQWSKFLLSFMCLFPGARCDLAYTAPGGVVGGTFEDERGGEKPETQQSGLLAVAISGLFGVLGRSSDFPALPHSGIIGEVYPLKPGTIEKPESTGYQIRSLIGSDVEDDRIDLSTIRRAVRHKTLLVVRFPCNHEPAIAYLDTQNLCRILEILSWYRKVDLTLGLAPSSKDSNWQSQSKKDAFNFHFQPNAEAHTSATGSEDSTQFQGCSYAGNSNSERVADWGMTSCRTSFPFKPGEHGNAILENGKQNACRRECEHETLHALELTGQIEKAPGQCRRHRDKYNDQ